MLLEEIDWFKDRLLFGRDDYLVADRTGRGFALAESKFFTMPMLVKSKLLIMRYSMMIDRFNLIR
jgi:hypothetical protein